MAQKNPVSISLHSIYIIFTTQKKSWNNKYLSMDKPCCQKIAKASLEKWGENSRKKFEKWIDVVVKTSLNGTKWKQLP